MSIYDKYSTVSNETGDPIIIKVLRPLPQWPADPIIYRRGAAYTLMPDAE